MRKKGIGLSLGLAAILAGFVLNGCSVLGTVDAPVGGEANVLALAAGETEEEFRSQPAGGDQGERVYDCGHRTVFCPQ